MRIWTTSKMKWRWQLALIPIVLLEHIPLLLRTGKVALTKADASVQWSTWTQIHLCILIHCLIPWRICREPKTTANKDTKTLIRWPIDSMKTFRNLRNAIPPPWLSLVLRRRASASRCSLRTPLTRWTTATCSPRCTLLNKWRTSTKASWASRQV